MVQNIASTPVTDPFASVPPDTDDPVTGVRAWTTRPPGVFLRVRTGTFLDVDVAMRLTATRELRPRLPAGAKLRFVFDLRGAIGYSTNARQLISSWVLDERESIAKVVLLAPESAVFRMGLATLMLGLRTAGVETQIADSLADVVARKDLVPARSK